MPLHEPDTTDPMELCGVVAAGLPGDDAAYMTRCLAEEFLRLGHGPQEVMSLFRSPEYSLAHRAWNELGEVAVFTLVFEAAHAISRARTRNRPVEGGLDA